eukprot:scaffold246596_cov22-Tisochrysis_lutea.AAC.1
MGPYAHITEMYKMSASESLPHPIKLCRQGVLHDEVGQWLGWCLHQLVTPVLNVQQLLCCAVTSVVDQNFWTVIKPCHQTIRPSVSPAKFRN